MILPWSDGWEICNNEGFFVDPLTNRVYKADLTTDEFGCVLVPFSNVGDSVFRKNQICRVFNNHLYLFPDNGNSIEIYDIEHNTVKSIAVENSKQSRLGMFNAWCSDGFIMSLASGKGTLYIIDNETNSIVDEIIITNEKALSFNAIRKDNKIISISTVSNEVYVIDCKSCKVERFVIPVDANGFQTISWDGKYFWISGKNKELYIWNDKKNEVSVVSSMPEQFGFYRTIDIDGRRDLDTESVSSNLPLFYDSVFLAGYVWLFPWYANSIIRINTDSKKVEKVDTCEYSSDTYVDSNIGLEYKYQYTTSENKIGIYSFKQRTIFEIDSMSLRSYKKNYRVSDDFNLSQTQAEINWCTRSIHNL